MKSRSKRKKRILPIIIIILLLLGISYYYKKTNILKVTLINNLKLEINSEVEVKSLIKESNCKLNKSFLLDTSKLGKNTTNIKFNCKNKEKDYLLKYTIIDTEKPIITGKEEVSIYINENIDLLLLATVNDNSNENINIEIKGNYDISKEGKYNLSYEAKDSSGNIGTYDFILNVIIDKNNYTFTTSKGYIAKVINGVTYIDGILIANKTYSLPSNYGNGITTETQNAFNKMKEDATKENLNIYISSGFRSYYSQQTIYNNYVARDGQTNADTYSARAGHSEHQTGLAFDLNSIDDSFSKTNEGKWVNDNCYKYGLILRYPKGKEEITGYMYESWHLRYVGINLATKLYNNGNWITLEEYYGIDSKYN